jgi:hypothetical protein
LSLAKESLSKGDIESATTQRATAAQEFDVGGADKSADLVELGENIGAAAEKKKAEEEAAAAAAKVAEDAEKKKREEEESTISQTSSPSRETTFPSVKLFPHPMKLPPHQSNCFHIP